MALPDNCDLLDSLVRAVLRNRSVRLSYSSFDGESSRFVVQPLSLAIYDHQLYLVARRTADVVPRVYRFSRISDVSVGAEFEYPPKGEYDPTTLFSDTFGIVTGTETDAEVVEVRLVTGWAQYARSHRWHPSQTVRAVPGGVVVRLTVRVCHELLAWVLGFGPDAKVLRPDSLRERVLAAARATVAVYESSAQSEGACPTSRRSHPARPRDNTRK